MEVIASYCRMQSLHTHPPLSTDSRLSLAMAIAIAGQFIIETFATIVQLAI